MEIGALQLPVWAGLPSACPDPTALWGMEPAPQERGFPLDSPALHPALHCWPWPAPWAPAREQTRTPLPSTEWEGKGCGRPSQESQPGNRIKSGRMAGAAEGPGPGAGTWGWGGLGVAWRSREGQGAPCPQLCQAVEVRSLAATVGGGTQWEIALTPGSLLKGPDLLKGLAVLGRGHGRSQPLCPGV